MHTRFVVGSADVVTTPLKRNGLTLPAHLKHIKTTNSCQLKLSTDMLTKSRAACDVRKDAAKQMFSYEFTCVPECLVDKQGNAYHSNKQSCPWTGTRNKFRPELAHFFGTGMDRNLFYLNRNRNRNS